MAFGIGALIEDVGDTLQELAIDEGTIASILTALSDVEGDIPDADGLAAIVPTAFGTLPAGTSMGTHTTHAHTFLLASMAEMLKTLGLFDQGIRAFKNGTNRADEFSQADLRRIHSVVEQTTRINTHQRNEGGHR